MSITKVSMERDVLYSQLIPLLATRVKLMIGFIINYMKLARKVTVNEYGNLLQGDLSYPVVYHYSRRI